MHVPGGQSMAAAPLDFPERVGRYELLIPIASGGMARVFLALSRGAGGFETEVALKLTHAHLRVLPEFANDLLEEGKLAARIRHRNVVTVLDVGDDPHGIYLVMEYVEGDTLAGLVKRAVAAGHRLPLGIAVRILVDACAGLHAAHELKDAGGAPLHVVHRDFTPHNILVGTDGVSRLTDFGIAKAASRLGHTSSGLVKGKIAYMPPEQAKGSALDRRCDVWAAGVVAWELFAGRRLYTGQDDVAVLLQVVTAEPPRLSTILPDIPRAIDDAIASALEPRVDARCPTAAAFAKALALACRGHVPIAEPDEVGEYVTHLVGPKLAERRAQAAEVRSLREKVGAIAGAAVESDVQSASGQRARSSSYAREEDPAAPTVAVASGPFPQSTAEPTRTDTSSVIAAMRKVSIARVPVVWAAATIGVCLVLGAVVVALWQLREKPTPSNAPAANLVAPPIPTMQTGSAVVVEPSLAVSSAVVETPPIASTAAHAAPPSGHAVRVPRPSHPTSTSAAPPHPIDPYAQ